MFVQAFPVLMGEVEPSGNLNANIIHQFTKNLRCKFISQVWNFLMFMQTELLRATTVRLTFVGGDTSSSLRRLMGDILSPYRLVKALSPVSTTRVHGPSWQPMNSGAFFDSPSWRVSKNAPEFTGRQLGLWTWLVETGLYWYTGCLGSVLSVVLVHVALLVCMFLDYILIQVNSCTGERMSSSLVYHSSSSCVCD